MRMIAAKWKLWIVILITSLLRVDGAAKLVLTISSYRSNSKKKDRKEGQKLIQGAMIRKDGRRKKKRRDQKNEVDLLAAELAQQTFLVPLHSPLVCPSLSKNQRLSLSQTLLESTSFDPSAITTCPGALQRTLFADQSTKIKDKKGIFAHRQSYKSPSSLILKRFMEELNFWRLAIIDWFWY